MKKPKLQVLVRGFQVASVSDSDPSSSPMFVSILDQDCSVPTFATSQTMFQNILQDTGGSAGSLDSIPFVIHTYTVASFEPLTKVRIIATSDRHMFLSSKARKEPKPKPRQGLLTDSPRKRKKRHSGNAAKSKAGKQQKLDTLFDKISKQLVPETSGKAPVASRSLESDLPAGSGSSISDESSLSSSSDSDVGSEEEQVEKIFLTDQASVEEKLVDQALENHGSKLLREERDSGTEAEKADGPPGPLPSSSSKGPEMGLAAPVHRQRDPQQCHPMLGLLDVGIQVASKLATCRFCSSKIEKGTPRFAYAFNLKKFHCWLHGGCVLSYLQSQKGDFCQALAFLRVQLNDQQHPPVVFKALKELEADLSGFSTRGKVPGITNFNTFPARAITQNDSTATY